MVIYFSNISVCEIYSGLREEEIKLVNKLFTSKRCLDVTLEVSIKAGELRKILIQENRKIKTPDAIIAITAMFHNLELVTRDTDFENLSGHGIKVKRI